MMKTSPVVLFGDPDVLWTRPVRSELRRRGARTMTATSTAETLQLAKEYSPDLIVVDERLQKEGERDIAEILREQQPGIRVIRSMPFSSPLDSRGRLRGVRSSFDEVKLLHLLTAALGDRLHEPLAADRKQPLVLCVDDDLFYLRALGRLLKRHGYRIESQQDPERALKSIPELAPDLAILDVMMPGMSGLNLAEEIRKGYGDRIPVILLTARGEDADILEGYSRGARYYITKPCEPRRVLNIVDYLVGDLEIHERERLEVEL